jgi:hypothetical protein
LEQALDLALVLVLGSALVLELEKVSAPEMVLELGLV